MIPEQVCAVGFVVGLAQHRARGARQPVGDWCAFPRFLQLTANLSDRMTVPQIIKDAVRMCSRFTLALT